MSDFFMREIEVLSGGKKITFPGYQIDFRFYFNDESEPNDGEIIIYNLTDDTTNIFKKGQEIILNAGYKGNVGTIFAGTIDYVSGGWEGVDRLLVMEVGDATDMWANKMVNKSYRPGVKSSFLLKDLLNQFGLKIGVFQLPNDIVYTKGKTFSSSLQTALRTIVEDCGAKFHIVNGSVYINSKENGVQSGFVLNSKTGLIESPQRIENEEGLFYKVKALLNHRIHADSIIKLESKAVNGWFRVVSGKHIGTEYDFLTEMEVVAV